MRRFLSTLTLNQKLAIAALLLGAGALFAQPQAGHAVSISPRELARVVETESDQVTARDLAGWIIAGRANYRLLDVRDAAQYDAYHIPGAELVPLTSLPDRSFAPTEKLVVYADGAVRSAQAWFLLRAGGARNAYLLQGGLDAWKAEVLFPTMTAEPTPEQQRRDEERRNVAVHFGGQALAAPGGGVPAAAAAVPAPTMPKVDAPPAPAGGNAASPRKRKEGC
jgi:rhodanese-related sulfurtransferase